MERMLGRVLACAALALWAAHPLSAFSAQDFLDCVKADPVLQELESSLAMAEGNAHQKKSISSIKKRISEEKRRVDNVLRELKPLALKVQQRQNIDLQDGRGRTLLMFAAKLGNEEAIDMVLREKAQPGIVDNNGKNALEYDRQAGGLLASRLTYALEEAMDSGDYSLVRQYCRAGLPVDCMLPGGPLVGHLVLRQQYGLAVELCKGARIENAAMSDGRLLSELMVSCGDDAVLRTGAELFGKSLWRSSPGGADPLAGILCRGHLPAVQLYVNHNGVDAQLRALAVRHSTPEVVTWLLQKSESSAGGADAWGSFPLFEAARRGNMAVYEAVLAAGADVNARNTAGETVLMHAALSGSEKVVNAVLNTISPDLLGAADSQNRTAVDYARMAGSAPVEQLLGSRGGKSGGNP